MRRHFASANPTRLRRVQAGGGHAALAWLMGWRREARHPRRWRLIARAIAWARVAPALGAGPLWGSGLADATGRPPASGGRPAPRRRRAAHLKPRAPRPRATPAPTDAAARTPTRAADLPRQAGRALLSRVGGAFANVIRTAERPSPRRSISTRRTPPPAIDEGRLAGWRHRLLDRCAGRAGGATEWAASDAVDAQASPAWATPIDGPAADADLLGKSAGERRRPGPAKATDLRHSKTTAAQSGGRKTTPRTLPRFTPARNPPPPAPGAMAARAPDLSRYDDLLDALDHPHPGSGDPFVRLGESDHRPPALSRGDDLLDAFDHPHPGSGDPFARLGEIDHRPPAPLGPFALAEETAPRHALPRDPAPDQSLAIGSKPSHTPPRAPRPVDLTELTTAIEDILRNEARRHGIDV